MSELTCYDCGGVLRQSSCDCENCKDTMICTACNFVQPSKNRLKVI